MKYTILFILVFLLFQHTTMRAQGGSWMWIGGSTSGSYSYGTISTPDSTNWPPPRYECAYWIDLSGNLWIFGSTWLYNDLWKYDVKLNQWIWMKGPKTNTARAGVFGTKGVPSKTNNPPGRGFGANCWTDKNGDLWLFGGDGYDSTGFISGPLQDLWRFNIPTSEWTWMGGKKSAYSKSKYGTKKVAATTNWPGGTEEGKSGWVDDSNYLWMFGGRVAGNHVNDMWRYSVSTNEWTYMKGDNSFNGLKGHHGKLGVETSTNLPEASYSYVRWKDCEGNFYTYGSESSVNDLWKFNPKSNNWTWIWGDTTVDSGKYVAFCASGNHPGPRLENTSPAYTTKSSVMWNFGGNTSYWGVLNDLWYFDVTTLSWKWVSGTTTASDAGVFGTKGVASKSNRPPSRMGAAIWVDSANNVWVFGGQYNTTGNGGSNDLWKFIPDTSCVHLPPCLIPVVLSFKPDSAVCVGTTVSLPTKGFAGINVLPGVNTIVDTVNHVVKLTPRITTRYVVYYKATNGFTDSLHFTIYVNYKDTINIDTGLCQGSNYTLPKGEVISSPGIYRDTLKNHGGCDSIITTTIYTKLRSYRAFNPTICANTFYILPHGTKVNTAGVYLDTFVNHKGCDSIVTTTLQVNPANTTAITDSMCRGGVYILPKGRRVNAAGVYVDTLHNQYGCDSIIITTLHLDSFLMAFENMHICPGGEYVLPKGKRVNKAGVYTDTLRNQYGCDSIIQTTLRLDTLIPVKVSKDICQGDAYYLPGGRKVSAAGIYTDTLHTSSGCDSVVITNLSVWPLAKAAFSLVPERVVIEVSPDVHFTNESINWVSLNWAWSGSAVYHTADTVLAFYTPGTYCITLKAFNYAGCYDTVTHCFTVADTTLIDVPTAFTPNGDGNNDVFFPLTRGNMRIKEFRVYNRWGELLYDKPVHGWDGTFNGKAQPQGTYIYTLIAEDFLNPAAPKQITQKGDVELIR